MMVLGHELSYWLRLQQIMEKYRLTERDFDRIDGALSAIRNRSLEERVTALEKRIGV